ncbi:MAG: polysaccharide lyase [Clostridia bacterium]
MRLLFLSAFFFIGNAMAAVDPADILGQAQADVPFARQTGWGGQFLGKYPDPKVIPESGVHGAPLANGETLRFGKVDDPARPGRKALLFQLSPEDPMTSSSKRTEIAFDPSIEEGRVYWIAFSLYVYDWGRLPRGDESLFGTQVHSGDNRRGLSPSFTLGSLRGDTFVVSVQYSTSPDPTPRNMVSRKYPEMPIPFGRWTDFVFRFRHSQGGDGFLQAWMDGREIVEYHGPLGFHTPGYKDYAKFGYYNWSRFDSSRKVLLRSPVLVADPTGTKYREADLRQFVAAH